MQNMMEHISNLKKQHNAVILAHSYQPGEIQDIADYVGDSYGLSVEATKTKAGTIIFCGVMFMAETAAILNPEKTVIIPEPSAGCPMADMITAEALRNLRDQYPSHLVMCYVNSTAEVKALSDICCTSSNALSIVKKLPDDTGIIFVPDKHLGSWIEEKTGRKMILWNGFCPTHARITPEMILAAKKLHPHAPVLIHPEAEHDCRVLADEVLSTGGMCSFARSSPAYEFIIATETGIIHTLNRQNTNKSFYPVSQHITCPNMKRCTIEKTLAALEGKGGAVVNVDANISSKAWRSLDKMLKMSM